MIITSLAINLAGETFETMDVWCFQTLMRQLVERSETSCSRIRDTDGCVTSFSCNISVEVYEASGHQILTLSDISFCEEEGQFGFTVGTMWDYVSKADAALSGGEVVGSRRAGDDIIRKVVYDVDDNIIIQDAYLGDKYDDFGDGWFSHHIFPMFDSDPPTVLVSPMIKSTSSRSEEMDQ